MHQVPRSTVAGGQVPLSSATVLPAIRVASFTVGIAAAGNLPFLPNSSSPPG